MVLAAVNGAEVTALRDAAAAMDGGNGPCFRFRPPAPPGSVDMTLCRPAEEEGRAWGLLLGQRTMRLLRCPSGSVAAADANARRC
eukprot:gene16763-42782_t